MSMLQTVAMATKNLKDNHFLLFSTYLLLLLELASVKYLETRQCCENDFGQQFNLKKIYLKDSYNFLFLIKEKEILRYNLKKIIL